MRHSPGQWDTGRSHCVKIPRKLFKGAKTWLACLFCISAFPFFLPGSIIGFWRWSNDHLTQSDHEGKITASAPMSWSHGNVILEFYWSRHVQIHTHTRTHTYNYLWKSSNNGRQQIHTGKSPGNGRKTDLYTSADFGFAKKQQQKKHTILTIWLVHRSI